MAKNYKDFDESEGVWRTVGGRRIFIRNGQDLASAMKESGKFKSANKKKDDEEEKAKKMNETMDKRQAIIEKLDEETKDLEDYDKYNLAISKLEQQQDEMTPTERQYWVGVKERYVEEQKAREKNYDGQYEKISKDIKGLDRRDAVEIVNKELDNGNITQTEARKLQNEIDRDEKGKTTNETKQLASNSGQERISDNVKVMRNGDDYIVLKNGHNEKEFKTQNDAEKYARTLVNNEKEDINSESKFMEKRRNEIEYERKNGIYDGERHTDEKGNYKYQKELDTYNKQKESRLTDRDAKDLIKALNDEGSDFSFNDDVKIEDGKIKTSVGVFMPDERGYVERDLEIPVDKDETYESLELKIRDWQYQHSTPDTFENPDFKQTTNEYMNDKIKDMYKKDNLPRKTEIKTQGTSNRKEVSENIQAHILEYYDKPEDFIEQMDAMDYLPTKWRAGEELAKGGSYLIYNGDMSDFLNELKINPKGKSFSEDKAFNMYTSLIGRESAKLYDRLKKNAYNKYLKEHPNSKMTFEEFKDMRKQ